MRAGLAAATVAAALAAAFPATASAAPRPLGGPRLTEHRALAAVLAVPKVRDWVGRYDRELLTDSADYDAADGDWTVKVWAGDAGEIVLGRVDDATGLVEEAWTGPQVAWTMARGSDRAFGGRQLNTPLVWLSFCAVFLVGLADLRRPLSLRNLDLLALLGFTASVWYFNDGRVFTSVPLVYPVLAYLLGRSLWIGLRDRPLPAGRPVWPVWLLAAATVFLAGFRIGLELKSYSVTDVGYASFIGADRIAHGSAPYGHFPQEVGRPCAPPDRYGRTVFRIQEDGRCEPATEHGDTYGPVVYEAYLPAWAVFGWKGKGDHYPAARAAAIALDLLCIAALALVGLRFGGRRLAATLAFAWAAYPFTQYVSASSANDALLPLLLLLGFWLASSAPARGVFASLAALTKFSPLVVAPLWATYPERRLRPALVFVTAFVVAGLVAFWVLLLEPHPLGAAARFWQRTVEHQFHRRSPFSLWDWRQYHAGLPDLHVVQRVLQVALVAGAAALAVVPRRKSPLQLAALTAALLIGFEAVLTHWFYLYIVWFFPFVAIAVLWPGGEPRAERDAEA